MKKVTGLSAWSFLALFALAQGLFAGSTGKISGRVYDKATGEGLPGANIFIVAEIQDGRESRLNNTLGAASNIDGNYVILNVPPGVYNIRAQFIGYRVVTVTHVRVSVDLTSTVDFPMSEEAIMADEVVIVAEREIIKKDLTSSEARVNTEQIDAMPVQEIDEVLSLQAGVTLSARGIHIRGGRASEVAYFVDGVSITDSYDKSQAVQVENASVQELQVISGTFNAEYGEAMSGIINIVTKDGGDSYHGDVNLYAGDYVSAHDDIFIGVDQVKPLNTSNAQFSLSGPVPGLKNNLTFFATGRYFKVDGYLNGWRVWDRTGNFVKPNPVPLENSPFKYDGEIVPMNWQRRYSGQLKLTFKIRANMNLQINALGSDQESQNYDHAWAYAPDGQPFNYDQGYTIGFKFTHTLNANSFYTLNVSQFYKGVQSYLYKDPLDPRYLHPDSLIEEPYNFRNSGTSLGHFERNTRTNQFRLDYTNQLNLNHQMKAGIEMRRHRIFEEGYSIFPAEDANGNELVPFQPAVPSDTSSLHSRYAFSPIEFSAYIQDKIELKSVIINIGLRFDYFNSNGNVLVDPSDPNVYQPLNDKYQNVPLEERLQTWYQKPTPKSQVSPRFGIAYPITDKGVIHFSYGYFLQRPSFRNLFQGTDYKVPKASGIFGLYGNADLNAERTIMYELGLKQQIGESIGIDITGFYRDIRDWIGTGPAIETVGQGGQVLAGRTYRMLVNRDYANVRGITLSISKPRASTFNYAIDYTFQVAEGSNSDPDEEFFSLANGNEPRISIVPLGWDQRHTLNGTFLFNKNGWGAGLIGRFSTGQPYTPSFLRATRLGQNANLDLLTNSRNKPNVTIFDLRLSKQFNVGNMTYMLMLNIFNLFDTLNEFDVYTDTGRATESSTFRQVFALDLYNNSAEEYLRQPFRFGAPREVQFGLRIGF